MITARFKTWTAVLSTAAAVYVAGNIFHPTVVVGQSMSPTLRPGRVIWVDKTYYKTHRPQRGEVVIFHEDDGDYVKRVYRGPGETVWYVAAGNDWIGPVREDRVDETRRLYERANSKMQVRSMRVPEDCVFVLGDNYLCSVDSRQLGPIPISDLMGRAHLSVDTSKVEMYEYAPHFLHHHDRNAVRPVVNTRVASAPTGA